MSLKKAKFLPAGDKALVVEFGNEISEEINKIVINLGFFIETLNLPEIEEVVPTYRSLLIYYNPTRSNIIELKEKIEDLIENLTTVKPKEPKTFFIPVLYGGEFGPDLSFVAEFNNISESEVIRLHTSVKYKIYMIGFAPGFPYLGGMIEKISAPRLETPRKLVKAGSVGIAGKQTGIYPIDDPGGWRIIGRTPIKIYNPLDDPPVLFLPGDYIKFETISQNEYDQIAKQVELGKYKIVTVHQT
ncbi:MAG: 5-oxoprolinase subunit PxpB [Desulfurella sp.]|uniref:5-oxoprolinase subunit PxpB n=1 Tax=Desulfurella sp. TaxID=1962857 RepID=UPI000CACA048|nr:MAG: allophanate hydrolase [Thermodesulfobium narugense]